MSIKARILSLIIILVSLVVVWLIEIALDTHFNSKIMRGAVYGAVRSIMLLKASSESTAPTGLCSNPTLDVVDVYMDPHPYPDNYDVRGAILTADKNYIIWGTEYGTIRRIRTSDFTNDLTAYSNHGLYAALTNGDTSYVWFGSPGEVGVPVTIDKFDTEQFLVVEQVSVAEITNRSTMSATISEDYQIGLWFTLDAPLIRVDLQNMVASLPLYPYFRSNSNRLAYNSYAYINRYSPEQETVVLAGIRISDFSVRESSIYLLDSPIAINRSNGLGYVIYRYTGRLLEVRLQDFAVLRVGAPLTGYNDNICSGGCDSVVDEVNNLFYTFINPSAPRIYVVNLDDLSVVEVLYLPVNAQNPKNMLLDVQNGYVYASVNGDPGYPPKFYKIDTCPDF